VIFFLLSIPLYLLYYRETEYRESLKNRTYIKRHYICQAFFSLCNIHIIKSLEKVEVIEKAAKKQLRELLAKVFFIMSFRQDFSRNPGKSSYGFPIKHFGNDK